MDYGHTNAKEEQPFFTDGAGTNDVGKNDINSNDNLDLNSSGAAKWGETPVRDPRSIGGGAMGSLSEMPGNPNQSTPNTELGQVIDMQMPPGFEQNPNNPINVTDKPPLSDNPDDNTANPIDLNLIRAEKDSISPKALEITEHVVDEFKKGAISPAELEAEKNKAMQAYLENSFGRKLAA